jgi:hypothetical protein
VAFSYKAINANQKSNKRVVFLFAINIRELRCLRKEKGFPSISVSRSAYRWSVGLIYIARAIRFRLVESYIAFPDGVDGSALSKSYAIAGNFY